MRPVRRLRLLIEIIITDHFHAPTQRNLDAQLALRGGVKVARAHGGVSGARSGARRYFSLRETCGSSAPPPGKLAPHLSSLRLYYRSVSVSRRKALESRLDEERLMNLTMRIPVVRLLEQRSGASSLRVTSEALSVFKHSVYCSKRLRLQDERDTHATDPLCTTRTPLCCICPWWDQGVNDPRRVVFPNIFAGANRRCAHIDVYSRERRVDFERRYCEGSPSNWLTFMRMLHSAQAHAEAAAPRDFFAIFLEDDAPPTPLWRKNLLDFFVGTPACGWDIARLSARVAGGFQGSAALMVHSSYVGTLLRHMESEPIGSIDVWLTDLQRGSRVPRAKSLPAPLMAHSPLPVFTPVVGQFNSSFGDSER